MKKNRFKLSLIALSSLLLISSSFLPFLNSCSNSSENTSTSNKNDSYNITFNKNYYGEDLNLSNIYASEFNESNIKEWVITKRYLIFNNGSQKSKTFYNENLEILNESYDDNRGIVNFKCKLYNSNSNGDTILSDKLEFSGFKIKQSSNEGSGNDQVDYYSISFNSKSSFEFGDKSMLASDVNELWIKNKIIDQKDKIFILSNVSNNFDWNSNLYVNSIKANDNSGELNFNVTLSKASNDPSKSQSISKQITFINFQITSPTPPIQNYYSISFNSKSSFEFGDQNKLPSTIDVDWIKNKIIEQKNEIFVLNNVSTSFDWKSNLVINSINPNDNNGELNFNVTLLKSSDDPNKSQSISNQITFTNFQISSPIPPTDGDTSNRSDWGNVLLPKVDDKLITEDDLVNMLDEHIGNVNFVDVTFGERMIDATLMADAFAKWITTRWKYFPYFGFSNPVFKISIKDENGNIINTELQNTPEVMSKKYYVYKLTTFKGAIFDYYADKWLIQGQYKNSFIEFVNDFLNLVSYDMDDIDKVISAYFYVANFITYGDSSSIEATIVNGNGVCADFASLMALLCNIIGVPTLPMVTNIERIDFSSMHEIVWVYINDLNGSNKKKWYGMDPTFAYTSSTGFDGPIAFFPTSTKLNEENVIFNFSKDSYETYPTSAHYNSNLFFNAPWQTLYLNNSLETKNIPSTLLTITGKSNIVYYDGYWYYLHYDEQGKNKLVRSKFVTSNKYEVVIDLSNPLNTDPSNLGFDNVDQEVCNLFQGSEISNRYAFGYNENIVLCSVKNNNQNNVVRFVIFNLKTKQYKLVNKTVLLKSGSLKTSFNFYIKDGEIYYTSNPLQSTSWKNKEYIKLELTSEEFNFLNSSSDEKTKLWRKIALYRTAAGTYLTGTNDHNNKVLPDVKRNFMQYLYNLEQNLNNGSISNYVDSLQELEAKYDEFVPDLTNEGLIKMNELCDVYEFEKSYVEESIDYLPLNKLIVIDNFTDFKENDNNIAFDIYHSKDKNGTFQKVKEELYLSGSGISVKKSDVGGDYNGYYYFEYYPYGLSNTKTRSKTFEVKIVDRKKLPEYEGLRTSSYLNTNYSSKNNNWYQNNETLSFRLNNMANIENTVNLNFKYINLDTKNIQTIESITVDRNSLTSNSYYQKTWYLNAPDSTNHGIYWVEFETSAYNSTYKFYSDFYYHFTKGDVDNFDISKWSEISNKI